MRPIKLTLQAFGPFAEKQEIDFRRSLDQRLFGFYGETGGGKTSILDGLCFALFGESSGSERKGEDLRSHHVGTETETFVELVFELGAKRYFVRRTPEQTVKAKRGSGETNRPHAAQLYDATGIDVEKIPAENCGALLAERVSPVGEKIGEILGYLAPQFRQVVLLPQGQFRDLLTAKSDKRSEILRRLFDVSLYERLVEEIKSEEKSLEMRVREARQAIGNLLSQHGVADAAALSQLIETGRVGKAVAEGERDRLGAANIAANDALHQANAVAEKFTERVNAQAALNLLDAKKPEVAGLEARLSRVVHARSIVPLDDRFAEKTLALKAASNSLEAARSKKIAAEGAFKTATETLQASLSLATEREAHEREVVRLAELEQRVKNAVPIEQESKRLKKLAETASASFVKAEGDAKLAESVLVAARSGEADARNRQTRIAELVGVVSDATRQRDAIRRYVLATSNVEQQKERLQAANLEWTNAKSMLAAAEGLYLDAETALSGAQAVHLASKLVDGEPCSVCGSDHHPSPAVGSLQSKGLNKAFEDARDARQAASDRERLAQSKHVEINALLSAAEANLQQGDSPQTTIKEVEASLATAQEELSALRMKSNVETAAKAVVEADQKFELSKKVIESARLHKDEAASGSVACAQKLASAFEGIDPLMREVSSLATALAAAQSRSSAARLRHETAVGAERTSQRAVDQAMSAFNEQSKAHETATTSAQKAEAAFAQAIEALGWSSSDYVTAKIDIEGQGDLTLKVQDFHSSMKSARDRLSRSVEVLQGLTQPDVPILTDVARRADAASREAVAKHAQIVAALTQQEATEARCNEIRHSLNDAESRYAVMGELKNLTSGANSIRMSLVDYAIAATFEDVLEAANLRFTRMSRGRFSLQRRTEMKDGRSRAGLEIIVHDVYTDRVRDAHTLSGGESFMAALSLALGLSDVVQQRAGGIKLDVIFIDEGFGSLDEQTLDNALSALRDLVGSNRAVGVISHVETVKQQIQAGFDISRGLKGSYVTQRTTAN